MSQNLKRDALLFLVSFPIFYSILSLLPFKKLVVFLTCSVHCESANPLIVYGKKLVIIQDCTGIHLMALVLAFGTKSKRSFLFSLLFLPSLILLNLLRIFWVAGEEELAWLVHEILFRLWGYIATISYLYLLHRVSF